ncbi:hypothetical protein Pelo_5549 [Pelomyxa schiedti]|nr:hypothetical protein Pelo_5549 [Pelomyxa schiedti]
MLLSITEALGPLFRHVRDNVECHSLPNERSNRSRYVVTSAKQFKLTSSYQLLEDFLQLGARLLICHNQPPPQIASVKLVKDDYLVLCRCYHGTASQYHNVRLERSSEDSEAKLEMHVWVQFSPNTPFYDSHVIIVDRSVQPSPHNGVSNFLLRPPDVIDCVDSTALHYHGINGVACMCTTQNTATHTPVQFIPTHTMPPPVCTVPASPLLGPPCSYSNSPGPTPALTRISPVRQWASTKWTELFNTASIGTWDMLYQNEILPAPTRAWLCELVSIDRERIKQKDWITLCEYLIRPSTDRCLYWDQAVIDDWKNLWFHGLLEYQQSVISLRAATVSSCFVRCSNMGAPVYTVVTSPFVYQEAFPERFVQHGTRIARRWPECREVWLSHTDSPYAVPVNDDQFGWYMIDMNAPQAYYPTLEDLCAHLSCVQDSLLWGRLNYNRTPVDHFTALNEQKEKHRRLRNRLGY